MKKVFAVLLISLMLFLPISVSAQLAPASAPQSALQQFLNSPDLKVVVGKDAAASDQKIANDLYQQYSYNIREKILEQQRSSEKDIVPGKFLMAADTDYLELNETLGEVFPALGAGQTPMLQGKWVNTKIDHSYQTQSIQFPNSTSTAGSGGGRVTFTKNEFEETGTFLHWLNNEEVYTYTLQFEPGLKSEANGSITSRLPDFIDRSFNIAGREYLVVNSRLYNSTKGSGVGIEIVLAHGAVQDDMGEGQVKTYALGNKLYKVEALIVSEDNQEALFKVNGETLPKLRIGELSPLKDGTVFAVRDVIRTKKDVQQTIVRFYLAPEYGELRFRDSDINDGLYELNSLRINGELQENTDIRVTGISINPAILTNNANIASSPSLVTIDRIQFRLKNSAMMDGNVYLKPGQKISETQMDPESFKTFFDLKYEGNTNAKPLPQLKDDLRKKYAQQTLFSVNFNGNLEFEQLQGQVGGSRIGSTITVKHDKCDLLPQQAQAAENLAQRAKDLGKEDVAKEYLNRKEQLEKEYREDCLYGPQAPVPASEAKSAEAARPILPSDDEVKACVEQKQAGSVYQTAKKSLENANTEYAKKNFLDKLSELSEDFERDCKSELTIMPETKKEEMTKEKLVKTIKVPRCGTPRAEEVMMCMGGNGFGDEGVIYSLILFYTLDNLNIYMRALSPTGKLYDVPIVAHDNAEDVGPGDKYGNMVGWMEQMSDSGSAFMFPYSAKRNIPAADVGTAGNWGGTKVGQGSGDIIIFADKRFNAGSGLEFAANSVAPDQPISFEGSGKWWVAKIKGVEVEGTSNADVDPTKVVLHMEDLATGELKLADDGTLVLVPIPQEDKSYKFMANLAANDDASATVDGADLDADSVTEWRTEVIFRDSGSPSFLAHIDVHNSDAGAGAGDDNVPAAPRLNFNHDASYRAAPNTIHGISIVNADGDPDAAAVSRVHAATITPMAFDLTKFNVVPEEGFGYMSGSGDREFSPMAFDLTKFNVVPEEGFVYISARSGDREFSSYFRANGEASHCSTLLGYHRSIANDGSSDSSTASMGCLTDGQGADASRCPTWSNEFAPSVICNLSSRGRDLADESRNRDPTEVMTRFVPSNANQVENIGAVGAGNGDYLSATNAAEMFNNGGGAGVASRGSNGFQADSFTRVA